MEKISLILILHFLCGNLFSQEEFKLVHCNCADIIEETNPTLNGDYKRVCDGKIIEKGSFINDKKDGEWIVRSKKGKVVRRFTYQKGKLDGKVELFYPNGKNKLIGFFKDGLKTGTWEYYNEKGRIVKECSYKAGVAKGIWKVYDWKGKQTIIKYDFEKGEYQSSNFENTFFEEAAILQNDNSAEWFILSYPQREGKFKEQPIEGYEILNDLLCKFDGDSIRYMGDLFKFELLC